MQGLRVDREIQRRSKGKAMRHATALDVAVLEWHRARARLMVSNFRESARARRLLAVSDAQAIRHIRCARSWCNAQARPRSSREGARDGARERRMFLFDPFCR